MSISRRVSSGAPCLDDVTKSILSELLGTSPSLLPEIEPDPEAIAFLKAFASHADIHTKIANAEIEHASLLKTHYHFEERRIQEQLKLIGITRDALTKETQSIVWFVAQVMEKLQVRKPTLNHALCKWSELCLQELSINAKHAVVKEVTKKSKRVTEEMRDMASRGAAAREAWSKPSSKEDLSLPVNAHEKIKEYQLDTQKCREELNERGFVPELSHQSLVQKAQQLDRYREQTASLKAQLSLYHPSLPRDMDAARTKLAEMQSELELVKNAIHAKIASDQ